VPHKYRSNKEYFLTNPYSKKGSAVSFQAVAGIMKQKGTPLKGG